MVLARAFWITEPEQGAILPVALAPPAADEVQLKTAFSGISRGTESLVWHGRVPPSQYATMRAPFQEGDLPFPVKYGYCNVAKIEIGPPNLVGRWAFSLFPHQTRFVVPLSRLVLLPTTLPPRRAILAANLETAINALWDSPPHLGDRIAVVGAGVVGSLTAWLCRQIPGAQVALVDLNPQRREIAHALGVDFFTPGDLAASDWLANADRVFHASGHEAGLETALNLLAKDRRLIELSWFGDRPVTLFMGGRFHSQRLTVQASQVGSIPPHQADRWTYHRRLALAIRLLEAPELDHLISGTSVFSELPKTFGELMGELPFHSPILCHCIDYQHEE